MPVMWYDWGVVGYGCGVVWLWCGTVVVWYGCGVVWLWCSRFEKNSKNKKRTMFESMTVGRSSKDRSQSMSKVVD